MSNNSSSPSDPTREQLFDLMVKQTTSGTEPNEQQQLETDDEVRKEMLRIESTAAAFHLALASDELDDSMPAGLMERLSSDATEFFQKTDNNNSVVSEALEDHPEHGLATRVTRPEKTSGQVGSPVTRREVAAMLIAAACLLLVFTGLNPLTYNPNSTRSPEAQLASFVSSRPEDLIDLKFSPVHQAEAGGRVIWSDAKQEGYMVLTGIKPNDPSVSQYQLWIFETPTQKYPIDGGVFDFSTPSANAKGEVIIPINAKIPVKQAVQFAVTEESPGGVVVSLREKIPVLASLKE